jgi:hypothetical protein
MNKLKVKFYFFIVDGEKGLLIVGLDLLCIKKLTTTYMKKQKITNFERSGESAVNCLGIKACGMN